MNYETLRPKDFIFEAQRQIDVWADISGPSVLNSEREHMLHSHVDLDSESTAMPTIDEINGARIFPKKTNFTNEYTSLKAELQKAVTAIVTVTTKAIQYGTGAVSMLHYKIQAELEETPTFTVSPAIEAIRSVQKIVKKQTPRRITITTMESVQFVPITVNTNDQSSIVYAKEEQFLTQFPEHTSVDVSMFRLVLGVVYRELVFGSKQGSIDNK